jgi:hypothetical protein
MRTVEAAGATLTITSSPACGAMLADLDRVGSKPELDRDLVHPEAHVRVRLDVHVRRRRRRSGPLARRPRSGLYGWDDRVHSIAGERVTACPRVGEVDAGARAAAGRHAAGSRARGRCRCPRRRWCQASRTSASLVAGSLLSSGGGGVSPASVARCRHASQPRRRHTRGRAPEAHSRGARPAFRRSGNGGRPTASGRPRSELLERVDQVLGEVSAVTNPFGSRT